MFRRLVLVVVTGIVLIGSASDSRADWRRFRGPNGTGVAESGAPLNFGEKENLKWQLDLPGRGVSSPIVVGDKVFVTCYSGYGTDDDQGSLEDLKRHLVCVDRRTGKQIWSKTVAAKMPEDPFSGPGVPAHGYASHTPTSDGERVYCFFGKSGVYAFDLDGNQLWNTVVGTESARSGWGSAASPIVHENFVIINASDESQAIVWLDKKTGEEKHRAEAAGLENSWATPAVVKTEEGNEIVVNVPGEVWGFNAVNGKLRWYSKGTSDHALNSVLVTDNLIFTMGGRGGEAIAVRPGGSGDVDASHVVWEGRAQGRYATPLFHKGLVFSTTGQVATCHDAESGERLYQVRLSSGDVVADSDSSGNRADGGGRGGPAQRGRGGQGGRGRSGGRGRTSDYASPVIADGKIYITTGAGMVYVVAAKPEFRLLAKNDMTFDSSGFGGTPAISDGQIFLRSNSRLYCIAED